MKTQFKLLLPNDLLKAIEDAAEASVRSRSSEIIFALRQYYGKSSEAAK